ncbi:MAG: LuxR C-terminal-related transcriptional regulator [Actinobacteria bacterium]|nr:LuxR C-terminal-related transcriptional regulator [Actinomycetota bacterium]
MTNKVIVYSPLEIYRQGVAGLFEKSFPKYEVIFLKKDHSTSESEFNYGVLHIINHYDFLKISSFFNKTKFPIVILCRNYNATMLEKIFDRKNAVVFKENLSLDELKEILELIIKKGRASSEELRKILPFAAEKMINIESLTLREREVLYLMARGMTTYSISLCLNISVHTVRNHVHRIYNKLGVNDKVSAIMKAISLGILSDFFDEQREDKEDIFDI